MVTLLWLLCQLRMNAVTERADATCNTQNAPENMFMTIIERKSASQYLDLGLVSA